MNKTQAFLIFPNQLFVAASNEAKEVSVYLIEDDLFFGQYPFHKKKLILHRASMQAYFQTHLSQRDHAYYLACSEVPDMKALAKRLKKDGIESVRYYDLVDDWLSRRLHRALEENNISYTAIDSPGFLCTRKLLSSYFKNKKKYLLHHFYVGERKRLHLLIENDEPLGGQWSLDQENRKKIPKDEKPAEIHWPKTNRLISEAESYVDQFFSNNYGESKSFKYPITREQALCFFDDFLKHRFEKFGVYQDAIQKDESFLFHSLLTPALNIGLVTPDEIIERTLAFAKLKNIPLNSLEGFVRQIVGWREFIRGVYTFSGRKQRTRNAWKHTRKIPKSFWEGTTGIDPIDCVIKRVLESAYAHHIERLMILGNFMLLCEFDPDEVYLWFMELFIDAYDWVMVPNVYGMSQFADGGLMATKPYISSSNYILKMSNFKKGSWCDIWDGLFWRFIEKHRDFFENNPRLSMMTRQLDKMDADKKKHLNTCAEKFLKTISK